MAICYAEYKGRTVEGYIRYCNAKIAEKRRNESYQNYIADCMAIIAKVDKRWIDILHPEEPENEYQTAINNFYSDFGGKEE